MYLKELMERDKRFQEGLIGTVIFVIDETKMSIKNFGYIFTFCQKL